MLCVHNLARSAQAVELDLSEFEGRYPVEMFGRSRFPRDRRAAVPAHARAARLLLVPARRGRAERPDESRPTATPGDRRRAARGARCTSGSLEQRWFALQGARGRAPQRARGGHAARGRRRSSCSRSSRRASTTGTHELYQLPLGLRPADEGWDERVIAEVDGWTVYDALADPAHGARAAAPDARLGRRRGASDGMLALPLGRERGAGVGGDGRRAPGRRRAVQLLDRVRRRADPQGRSGASSRASTPSSSCCASSPSAASRTSRRSPAGTSTTGRLMDATLGIAAGVPGRRARRLGARRSDDLEGVPRRARATLGVVTGELHTALGSEAADPAFAPEEPSTRGALAAAPRRSTRRSSGSSSTCPRTRRSAPIARPRPGRARAAAGARRTSAPAGA